MALETCMIEGCEELGLFPSATPDANGDMIEGRVCWDHNPETADGVNMPAEAPQIIDEPTFHIEATNGLASMILEHTAMCALEAPDAAGDAMRSLASNTLLNVDVCAGILLACSGIMAAGEVSAEQLLELAAVWEKEAEYVEPDTELVSVDDDAQASAERYKWNAGPMQVSERVGPRGPIWLVECDEHGQVGVCDDEPTADDLADAHFETAHNIADDMSDETNSSDNQEEDNDDSE